MTTIPFDPLLGALERKARALSPTEGYTFTAQRLLYAALDGVPAVENGEKAARVLEGYLRFRFEDVSLAKKVLGDLIGKKQATFFDDIYLKKRIWAASETPDGGRRECLSAMDLFVAIMKEAPDWLAPLIRKDTAQEESLTEEPEESEEPEEETPSQETQEAKDEALPAVGKTDFDVAMEELDKKKAEREGEIEVDDFLAKIDEAFESEKHDPADARREMSLLVDEVRRVRGKLLESVFGQDNAIGVFSEGYFRAKMFSADGEKRNRPLATYLFAGPPGVGKTFFAEVAADAMGLPFKRFDMSGYADKEAIVDFLGLNQSYKAAKAGTVTGFVKENPRCLLLFDEVEKAHITIIYLFLQMLDAGRLHDNYHDEDVSFRDTVIILTTNAGRQLYDGSETTDLSHVSRKAIIDALKKDVDPQTNAPYFPEAICSRFSSGNVILFNHIGVADLCRVAKKEVGRHVETLRRRYGIEVTVAEEVYSSLLYSVGSNADARTLRGRAESFFLNEVYELLRLISSAETEMGVRNIEKIVIEPDLEGVAEDVAELFRPSSRMRLLVYGEEPLGEVASALSDFDLIETGDEGVAAAALSEGVDLVLVNVAFREPSLSNLNLEDEPSPSRDFLRMLRKEYEDVPVYLLETRRGSVTEEERLSFLRAGVRGVLAADGDFGERMGQIAMAIYQQASIKKLARASKVVTFDTAQSISEDGVCAHIRLYDFRTERVVLSEDKDSVQSALSMPKLRFSDVIGAEDAKKELRYFVEYLKNPKKYLGTGVKAPRGLLLYGPPGTGKTMLAKALAAEAGVAYIATEGNRFLKKYVGEGPEEVHRIFRTARKYAPAVLFIDEIDAIAKERRGGEGAEGSEATLTALLTEMDGFSKDPSKPVFVLAATNFDVEPGTPKSLDPALTRRFDRHLYIDLPKREDRVAFLRRKREKNAALAVSDDLLDNVAMRSTGMSLAELDSMVEFSLRSAIREGATKVTDEIFEEAFETFNNGETKKWDEKELECTARHEAGHAFLCWHGGETPSYLTVIARGKHGGYMQHANRETKGSYTREELLSLVRTSLGGRAAELMYYGREKGVSTGASSDLAHATAIAKSILCTYGMDDAFGLAVISPEELQGALGQAVREGVNRILSAEMEKAIGILTEHRERVDRLVAELLNKNHLTGKEIEEVLDGEA